MTIFRIQVLKAKMPTYWYADQIGRYLYAVKNEKDKTKLLSCSAYGVVYREMFNKEDIRIVETIILKDKRVFK